MTGLDSIYFLYVKVLLKELLKQRIIVILLFCVILLAVEIMGLFYNPTFETSTLIHADQQNIIAPLLRGQAEITKVENHTQVVREVIYSPSMLTKLIEELQLLGPSSSPKQIESYQNRLRGMIKVAGAGPGFIKISSKSIDPAEAFKIVSKAAELFIKDAAETKRSESREAFLFIDKQVKTYKDQLIAAEENLKRFKEKNMDGTLGTVNARILNLKDAIADLELELEEADTKVDSLRRQLAEENKFVKRQIQSDKYQDQLRDAESKLAILRLSYTETYPDIITLKEQISKIKENIKKNESSGALDQTKVDFRSENPVYQSLRENLSEAEIEVQTLKKRIKVSYERLDKEHVRLKKIAEKEAQLAELIRDYDVTKGIYETMLDRKEKARLSMTLDVEGQGVTYKIQEPASFPLNPTGMRFLHFALMAPLVGLMVPIALVLAFIVLDPRIRLQAELEQALDIPVLGSVPHVRTRLSARLLKKDVLLLGLLVSVFLGAYVSIGILKMQGIL